LLSSSRVTEGKNSKPLFQGWARADASIDLYTYVTQPDTGSFFGSQLFDLYNLKSVNISEINTLRLQMSSLGIVRALGAARIPAQDSGTTDDGISYSYDVNSSFDAPVFITLRILPKDTGLVGNLDEVILSVRLGTINISKVYSELEWGFTNEIKDIDLLDTKDEDTVDSERITQNQLEKILSGDFVIISLLVTPYTKKGSDPISYNIINDEQSKALRFGFGPIIADNGILLNYSSNLIYGGNSANFEPLQDITT